LPVITDIVGPVHLFLTLRSVSAGSRRSFVSFDLSPPIFISTYRFLIDLLLDVAASSWICSSCLFHRTPSSLQFSVFARGLPLKFVPKLGILSLIVIIR
jgi:hypothetical protein